MNYANVLQAFYWLLWVYSLEVRFKNKKTSIVMICLDVAMKYSSWLRPLGVWRVVRILVLRTSSCTWISNCLAKKKMSVSVQLKSCPWVGGCRFYSGYLRPLRSSLLTFRGFVKKVCIKEISMHDHLPNWHASSQHGKSWEKQIAVISTFVYSCRLHIGKSYLIFPNKDTG